MSCWRNREWSVLLSLLLILPSAGNSQTIGLFFDAEGVETTFVTTTEPEVIPVFLILRQDGETVPVSNWECRISASGTGSFLSWTLAGGGLNALGNGQFQVYLPSPLPPAEMTPLASGQFLSFNVGTANGLFINPLTEPSALAGVSPEHPNAYPIFRPGIASGGSWQPVDVEGGCSNQAVALINAPTPPVLWAYDISETDIVLDGITGNGWLDITNTGQVPLTGEVAVTQGEVFIGYGSFANSTQSFTFTVEVGEQLAFRVADPGYNPGPLGELTIDFCGEAVVIPVSRDPDPNLPQISFSPESIDFGTVAFPLETPASISFTVNNSSAEPYSFNLGDYGAFSVVIDEAPLLPGESRDGEILFLPPSPGIHTSHIIFGANEVLSCQAWAGPRFRFEEFLVDFGIIEYSPGISTSLTIHLLNDTDVEYSFLTVSDGVFLLEIPGGPMLPNESREGLVTFLPEGIGHFEGDVAVLDADSLTLSTMPCMGNAGPFCFASPDTLDFGMWRPGDQSAGLSSVITNESNTLVEDIEYPVLSESPFEIFDAGEPFFLYPGGWNRMYVRFNPTALGTYTETVHMGDLVEPVILRGTCSDEPPQLYLTEDTVDFGTVYLDEYAHDRVYLNIEGGTPYEGELAVEGTIFNTGSGPEQVWFPGAPQAFFGVSFHPPDTGVFTGMARFEPDNGLEVQLTGYCPGPRPVMSVSPDELRFGYIPLGESREKSFQVTNLGPGPYSCGMYDIQDSTFSVSPDTLIVAEGETQTFTVTARGLISGEHSDLTRFPLPFPNVILSSVSFLGENPVRAGVFFDAEDFTVNEIQADAGEVVTAYLVVKGGDFWSIHNSFRWDGCLEIAGENQVLSVDYYNPEEVSGDCAQTYLDWPDPAGVRIAAEITIQVNCSDCVTEFVLDSPDDPIEPGLPNLIVGQIEWLHGALMACPTTTGQPLVAAINSHVTGVLDDEGPEPLPTVTRLNRAFPNPFNPRTTIRFEVSEQAHIQLGIFDVAGRRVKVLVDEILPPGHHEKLWDGRDSRGSGVASGVYFLRMESPGGVDFQKVVLTR